MNPILNFDQLTAHLADRRERRRVAVVCPYDESTLEAVRRATDEGFVEPTLIGEPQRVPPCTWAPLIEATDDDDAAARGVALVRQGEADVLMKGLLNTDNLLRAVLSKETGILPKGRVLTHLTCAYVPQLDRLLLLTDVAVIPQPTAEQRQEQLRYLLALAHRLGISEPRVSLINCTEKVNAKHFPCTVEYRELVAATEAGQYGPCIVDGPLDLKTSLSAEALHKKGIASPLEGRADALIFPDIQAGNVFYKTITLFAQARVAAILAGPQVPVVLTSRADALESKYYSLALACI